MIPQPLGLFGNIMKMAAVIAAGTVNGKASHLFSVCSFYKVFLTLGRMG